MTQFAVEVEVHAAAQFERADQITVAARHQDLCATRLSSGVNGALDGGGVHRDAIADGAKLEYVKDLRFAKSRLAEKKRSEC